MPIVAFSGHRPSKLGNDYEGTSPLALTIKAEMKKILLEVGATESISGMALGIDTWGAEVTLELGIPLIAAIPFPDQESVWPKQSQDKYNGLLAKASHKHYVCPGPYAAYKLQKRNEWMCDTADLIVAFWDGTSGGTANCVNYAKSIGKELRIINPWELMKCPS